MSEGPERLRESREEMLGRVTRPKAPEPITEPEELNSAIAAQRGKNEGQGSKIAQQQETGQVDV